jgi:hypothetical protein
MLAIVKCSVSFELRTKFLNAETSFSFKRVKVFVGPGHFYNTRFPIHKYWHCIQCKIRRTGNMFIIHILMLSYFISSVSQVLYL